MRSTEPCMQPDLRDRKVTCGYPKGHDGTCSFGPRNDAAALASEEPERLAAARAWIKAARGIEQGEAHHAQD